MATQLFSNRASALLAASIDDSDLTIQVANGFGALYPNPGAGEFFEVTLQDQSGNIEIVKIESRSSDLLTVASGGRGQGGTSAQSWTNGVTRVECRLTANALTRMLQREGGTMEGNLDMDENEIVDADLTGANTKIRAGQIVNVPLRGVVDDNSNEVLVPTDGSRATAGGNAILTEGDALHESTDVFPTGMVMMWYGAINDIPSGWALCDGTNGTPDMRGRFPMGASGSHAFDSEGGAETASGNTGSAGGHTPTGTVQGHELTEEEMPKHRHFVASNASYSGIGEQHLTAANQVYRNTNGAPGGDTEYTLRGTSTSATVGRSSLTGGGDPHDHDLAMDAVPAHTHALDSISVLPPYKALYFIMKT